MAPTHRIVHTKLLHGITGQISWYWIYIFPRPSQISPITYWPYPVWSRFPTGHFMTYQSPCTYTWTFSPLAVSSPLPKILPPFSFKYDSAIPCISFSNRPDILILDLSLYKTLPTSPRHFLPYPVWSRVPTSHFMTYPSPCTYTWTFSPLAVAFPLPKILPPFSFKYDSAIPCISFSRPLYDT